jgi:hypothetical protein
LAEKYVPANLVLNPSFSNSSNWQPNPGSQNEVDFKFDTTYGHYPYASLLFSYLPLGSVLISQTVPLIGFSKHTSYEFEVGMGCRWGGSFEVSAAFYDSNSQLLQTIGESANCDQYFIVYDLSIRTFVYKTTTDMRSAVIAVVSLAGQDSRYWAGFFGPAMTSVRISISKGNCTLCDAGTFSNVTGCILCDAGTFSDTPGEANAVAYTRICFGRKRRKSLVKTMRVLAIRSRYCSCVVELGTAHILAAD